MTFPKIISGRGEIPGNALNTAFSKIVLPKTGSQKRHFHFSLCSCAISFYIFYSFFCKEILHFKIEKSGECCVEKSAMKKIFSSNDDPPMTMCPWTFFIGIFIGIVIGLLLGIFIGLFIGLLLGRFISDYFGDNFSAFFLFLFLFLRFFKAFLRFLWSLSTGKTKFQ